MTTIQTTDDIISVNQKQTTKGQFMLTGADTGRPVVPFDARRALDEHTTSDSTGETEPLDPSMEAGLSDMLADETFVEEE